MDEEADIQANIDSNFDPVRALIKSMKEAQTPQKKQQDQDQEMGLNLASTHQRQQQEVVQAQQEAAKQQQKEPQLLNVAMETSPNGARAAELVSEDQKRSL